MAQQVLQLNSKQQLAVEHSEGPAVVFASAGSGKTRIITARILRLIESGIPPQKILAVTFTNRAAAEMRHRMGQLDERSMRATIATFHAACARWLREFAEELGFDSNFVIYDDKDSKSAIRSILAEMYEDIDFAAITDEMKYFIGMAKTKAWLPQDVEKMQHQISHLIPVGGIAVYKRYQEYLASCNAMDFGDLLLNMVLLLRKNKNVQQVLGQRYKYIMVDEYQDTNQTQLELLRHLSQKTTNLFVVGDDDQSIYSWRGASPENIIYFNKMFEGAKVFTLDQNYRSNANIVDAAGAMIQNNKHRADKKIWTENEKGEKISYILESDNEMEAWAIVDQIVKEKRQFKLDQVAIFYRTNAQSRLLEDALRNQDIPYKMYGGTKFYDRVEIKDLAAYLKLLINEKEDISFRRVVNVPARKFGKKSLEHIENYAFDKGISLWQAMIELLVLKDKVAQKIQGFVGLIQDLRKMMEDHTPSETLQELIKRIDYFAYLKQKYKDKYADKIDNVHELIIAIEEWEEKHENPNLSMWLQSVSLNTGDEEITEGVSMMTLHMAKGLEFERVHLAGVEDGLIPHGNNIDEPTLLEEERRLFYVGITRARQKLSFYGCSRRRTYTGWISNQPSRFLGEIPAKYLDAEGVFDSSGDTYDSGDEPDGDEYDYTDSQDHQLSVGSAVLHPTYGKGVLKELVQTVKDNKAWVSFADHGKRKVSIHHLKSSRS